MKVLHLYSGNLYGGVETLLATFARFRYLCPAMEPEFALCFRGRLWEELTATGTPVYDLGGVRLSRPWTGWSARRRLSRVLIAGGYRAVFAHCCWPIAVFGRAVNRSGVPLVYWAHDAGLDPPRPGVRRPLVERWASGVRVAHTLAISNFTRPYAAALFPEAPTTTYRQPVALPSHEPDPTDRARLREELGVPSGAAVIVQVSRMVAYKGHRLLLTALGRFATDKRWVCWFVGGPQQAGEGEYLDGLRRLAADLGIADRVRFLGDRRDVPRLLAAADIHCQPNEGPELFGITFVEGLIAGLPVVSTRIGAAPEILDGVGVLVPPADPDALAAELSRLVGDPELRARIGAPGPAHAAALCAPVSALPELGRLLATLPETRLGTAA